MKCPHCAVEVYLEYDENVYPLYDDAGENVIGGYGVSLAYCPSCSKPIVEMSYGRNCYDNPHISCYELGSIERQEIIYPKFPSVRTLSSSIPQKYAEIYIESETISSFSPRSSATLCRYLLQMILHEELNIKKRNLEDEIAELETKRNIPSTLVSMLQVMRRVANFAAHPKKSTNSNEIIDVEKGEVDIMLDLIYELFDYVFVKPQQNRAFLQKAKEKYGIEFPVSAEE